jgi:diphosphomevalonate decarboxylase
MLNYANKDLVFSDIPTGKVGWSSPSNIALIKYWGKKGLQIPMNPSLSFTLSKSLTETIVEYSPSVSDHTGLDFYFDGIPNPEFAKKTSAFFQRVIDIFPFIKQLDFRIYSKNTFPHSTGIASSASGMSALALALCDIENEHFNSFKSADDFYRKASYIARLGSGSACRSVYGQAATWGEINGNELTSNHFATKLNFEIHPVFKTYRDSILIVDAEKKKVSSTSGHKLMDTNIFKEQRIIQAKNNLENLINALKHGYTGKFIKIVENEALTLHALMMTSDPAFVLIKPNTLAIIDRVWAFREQTKLPVCFTLDAGPNIHLLYPNEYQTQVNDFISSIEKYTKGVIINDKVGNGPEKLNI